MKATKETRQRMILAVTGLLTPLALWIVFGLYERFAPRPEPSQSFFEMDALSPERRMQLQMLRSHLLAEARQGDWALVRRQADDTCGSNCSSLIYPLQAEATWRLGEHKKAADIWSKALTWESHVAQADFQALKGDRAGYKGYVAPLLARPEPGSENDIAWACVLLPDILADYTPVVALAEQGLKRASFPEARANVLNTLGVALYRAGRFEQARARLQESETLVPEKLNIAFIALCDHKLGKAQQAEQNARIYYQFMQDSLPDNSRLRHEYVLFEKELRDMLPPAPTTTKAIAQ